MYQNVSQIGLWDSQDYIVHLLPKLWKKYHLRIENVKYSNQEYQNHN